MRIGIIGCGIAGAYLGWRLSKLGHDVTIFEKKESVGGKACSGLISERLWKFVPKDSSLVENEIDIAEIHFPKKKVSLEFRPKMLVINRGALDKYVSGLAKKSGAEIILGEGLERMILPKKARPYVISDKGRVEEFDRIIGCDGANSKVRESLGIKKPSFRLGIYTILNKAGGSNKVSVWPTKNGFKWKIPRGKKLEIGVIERPEESKRIFNSFARKPKRIFAALVPEGLRVSKDGRVALCGDAAGLTKPWSGGGVIWALTAAEIFVRANCNVLKYNKMIESHFGSKILISKFARRAVYLIGEKMPWLIPKNIFIDSDWLY